jgi:hypothetical protein
MPSTFPIAIDAFTNPASTDLLSQVGVSHAGQHGDANDAIEAIETRIGITGSTDATSHTYKIATLESEMATQSVVPYADSTARSTAVPSPVEGQMSYLEDTNAVEVYDGTAWTSISGGGGITTGKAIAMAIVFGG